MKDCWFTFALNCPSKTSRFWLRNFWAGVLFRRCLDNHTNPAKKLFSLKRFSLLTKHFSVCFFNFREKNYRLTVVCLAKRAEKFWDFLDFRLSIMPLRPTLQLRVNLLWSFSNLFDFSVSCVCLKAMTRDRAEGIWFDLNFLKRLLRAFRKCGECFQSCRWNIYHDEGNGKRLKD